ncbi:MAG: transglutaminase domain-containing protein [Dehalococcoidia bacterium]|nr:transglutaminase domain-containing protein [Dehalococcoidia bacterium]
MFQNDGEYLQPSELCDFDRHTEIVSRAQELARGLRDSEDVVRCIFAFVKEFPYQLEDWDIPASETLARGRGMCSGKTNLLVAMLRSLGISARYCVYFIKPNTELQDRTSWNEKIKRRWKTTPEVRDHVDCEVWLDGWEVFDPSRDTALERGMLAMGIPLERHVVPGISGDDSYLYLASFDTWAHERQERRAFRSDREEMFSKLNEQFEQIRVAGRRRDLAEG